MALACPLRPQVAVRPAATGDVVALLPTWLAMMRAHAARDAAFGLADDAEVRWRRWIEDLIGRPRAFVLVAEVREGRLAGFAAGWLSDNLPIYSAREVGFVSELAVAPWARRRGVGSALVNRCRAWFAAYGVRDFQLATAVWNRSARAFWRAQGGAPLLLRYRLPSGGWGRIGALRARRRSALR